MTAPPVYATICDKPVANPHKNASGAAAPEAFRVSGLAEIAVLTFRPNLLSLGAEMVRQG